MTITQGFSVGARFRELRIRRRLSVHALAYLAGASPSTITLIEKYDLVPKTPRVREKIARALGVTPDWLFGDNPQGGASES